MFEDVKCHQCGKIFEAETNIEGKCPQCNNRYDWYWDRDPEICFVIFATEDEFKKDFFLISRDWV